MAKTDCLVRPPTNSTQTVSLHPSTHSPDNFSSSLLKNQISSIISLSKALDTQSSYLRGCVSKKNLFKQILVRELMSFTPTKPTSLPKPTTSPIRSRDTWLPELANPSILNCLSNMKLILWFGGAIPRLWLRTTSLSPKFIPLKKQRFISTRSVSFRLENSRDWSPYSRHTSQSSEATQ